MLTRLRTARSAAVRHWRGNGYRWEQRTLSQNELARRAGLNAAAINLLERAGRFTPRRATVLVVADALELNEDERARLLIAAGYWPWLDLDDVDTEFVVKVVLALVAGDWRRVDALGADLSQDLDKHARLVDGAEVGRCTLAGLSDSSSSCSPC